MAFISTTGAASARSLKQIIRNQSTIIREKTCSLFPSTSRFALPSRVRKFQRQIGITRMTSTVPPSKLPADKDPATVTEDEWRKVLSKEEFRILREKGTEYPGSGEYDGFYPKEGHFVCAACGNPLYSAASKFKSGCGWPAYDKCYKGSVKVKVDVSFGMRRVEIMCNKCDGHLGHVFEGERMTSTNERHCVNSVSVKYVPGPMDLEESKVV